MASKYQTHPIPTERTFVMIKPDAVMRGLVGEIIKRLEQRGLKIIALKMVQASHQQIDDFYPKNDEWVTRIGHKTLSTFTEYKLDPKEHLGTDDPAEIGKTTREAIIDFLIMAPVVPMVVEGVHAIRLVRKLAGNTLPILAEPGTIRGDYSNDAPTAANLEGRSLFNLVHASETPEEAAHEITHWFKPEELQDYDRSDHVVMFGDKRHQ